MNKRKKTGGRKLGSVNKKTILIQSLTNLESIQELRKLCLTNLEYFLNHSDNWLRFQATKEVSKYLFPTCQPTPNQLNENEIERLRIIASQQMSENI